MPPAEFPPAPAFHLERHQLALVLCQLRFSSVLRIRQDDAVIGFQEAIRHRYPRYSKARGIAVLVTPDGVQQQAAADAQHRFEDTDGKYTVVLTPDFVALETRDYLDVDDFSQRVGELAQFVADEFGPDEIQRVGLRFINEFRLNASDTGERMREAMSSELLGASASEAVGDLVFTSEQVLELRNDANDRMIVRHGFHPEGGTTVVQVVGPDRTGRDIGAPFYLLDLDVFIDHPRPYDVAGVEATLRRFNDHARGVFAWAVSSEFRRAELGERPLE